MLNPIGKFFAPWGVLDSHRAKFWSATQSEGFMPCVPSGLRNAADSAKTVHPIALASLGSPLDTVNTIDHRCDVDAQNGRSPC